MSAERRRSVGRHVATLGLLLGVVGCDWFTTFVEQPRLEPWEMLTDSVGPRGNAPFSVPIHGQTVPAYVISYQPAPATIDSFSVLPNPVPMSIESVQRGWRHYAINCAVCHGDTGAGNGSATRYGMIPISLLTPVTSGRSDGYVWGIIRNGRGIMPSYNRIEELDRWDVVNYVRALQGRGGITAPTGPVAEPGVTGEAVPGYSRTGPTQPVPHTIGAFEMLRQRPEGGEVGTLVPAARDTGTRAPADTGASGGPR